MSSNFNTYLKRFAHIFMYAFTFMIVLFAIAISAVRLYPNVSDIVEAEIQYHVGNALNADIEIESLEISRFHPLSEIVAKNVKIIDRSSREVLGSVHLAQVRVDFLASVFTRSLRIQMIALDGLDLFIHRDQDGKFHLNQTFFIHGGTVDADNVGAYDDIDLNLLSANIRWKDDLTGTDYLFEDIDISIDPTLDGYRALLQGVLPESIGNYVKMKIDFDGNLRALHEAEIDFYLYAEKFRLSEIARRFLNEEDGKKVPVVLTTEAWGVVEKASLSSLRGFATASDIVNKPKSGSAEYCLTEDYIRGVSMQYEWENQEGNWEFTATDIRVETDTKDWDKTELYIQQKQISENDKSIFAYLEEADIGEICNTLAAYSPHIVKFQHQLDEFRFNTNLNDLKIRFDLSENYQTSFQYSASISHAEAWFAKGNRKISGLDAFLSGGDLGGQAQIDSRALMISMPQLFPQFNIQLDAKGDVKWMQHLEGFSLQSREFSLSNNDIDLSARLDIRKQGEDTYSDAQFYIHRAIANRVGAYFPSTVGVDNTKQWLMNAIEAGRVSEGVVLLRGDLKDFPFDKDSGVFKIDLNVKDGGLEYLSGWPELTDVQASVRVNNERIDVYSNQAQIYEETRLENIHIYIDTFKAPVLNINGIAGGPTQNIIRFLEDANLLGNENTLSDKIPFEGDAKLKLNISKSLSAKITQPTRVSGEVNFTDNTLSLNPVDLRLEELNGTVLFDEKGFTGKDLTASVFNTPLFLSLTAKGDGASVLNFEGNFNISEYAKDQAPEFADVLSGIVPVHGSVYLPDPADKENPDGLEVNITSSLQGLGIDLPAPFDKKSSTVWPSSLKFHENEASFELDIEKKLYLDFAVSDDHPFDLRYVGLGKDGQDAATSLPEHLMIEGGVEKLPLDEWLVKYKALFPSSKNKLKLSDLPDLKIGIEDLEWATWPAKNIQLSGQAAKHGYGLELKSSHASGAIVLPEDHNESIVMNFSSFTLPEVGDESPHNVEIKPGDLPPVEFSSKRLNLRTISLRDVGFSIQPTQKGVSIDEIVFAAEDMTGKGNGTWTEVDTDKIESAFNFDLQSTDLEDTFEDLGFAGSIKKGEGEAQLSLQWEGGPQDFSLANLTGRGEIEIRKGSIKELDPGAGRLLALVNLNAITRRLSLDFKDVTNKGFTFDSIRARVNLFKGGDLSAQKVKIKSSAADIRISGSTNIIDETYNQTVSVSPSISGALPAAGAIVGGPVGAAAGVVADRLAHFVGLNKVVEYDYEITGTWEDPIIKRVRSREVEIKTNAPPSGAQPSGVQQSSQ